MDIRECIEHAGWIGIVRDGAPGTVPITHEVGWVGDNEVNALTRQRLQYFRAISFDHGVIG